MEGSARLMAGVLVLPMLISVAATAAEFTGKQSNWHGYERFDFMVEGRKCIVVMPKRAASGKPWIWRARFFGHEPQADVALLERGFHVAYCDVAGLFGSPKAVMHWNAFYEYVTSKHGFAKRVALEGMSRGGLIIYNWASENADKVSCIYADAPVCDIRSWPGGKGVGRGSAGAWRQCLQAYGISEEQAASFRGNPIDRLERVAKAKIPLLHVVGAADEVVPVAENTDVLAERYRKLGGMIEVISKEGVGHHPHSLKDPAPIVQFVVKHTLPDK